MVVGCDGILRYCVLLGVGMGMTGGANLRGAVGGTSVAAAHGTDHGRCGSHTNRAGVRDEPRASLG